MTRWTAGVIVSVALGIAVARCGSASDTKGANPAPAASTAAGAPTGEISPAALSERLKGGAAADAEVRGAFVSWLTTTVCAPGTAGDQQAKWCSGIVGVAFANQTLTARVLLPSNSATSDAALVCQRFSAFAFNNLNAKYGLQNIVLISDTDGKTLAQRRGAAGGCG